ncbi:DUF3040 domain-containing protein [Pseudonocardia spirodelae]|uniref:DUF3040 domain-containing protein n=1 Tax=Pseudonocardia spirodelae TaxID=3133431 RepID=A0ABU8TE73_9PSEU
MLSEREIRRLHEIEVQLRLTDPRLVRRFSALGAARRSGRLLAGPGTHQRSMHGAGPLPTALLGLALVVLLLGAVTVNVPVVVTGIVVAALALGVAATTGPQPRPGAA